MKKPDRISLIISLLSLMGALAPRQFGSRWMLLAGGLALLGRSFFPPVTLNKGIAAWFGGGLMGLAVIGLINLAVIIGASGKDMALNLLTFSPVTALGAGLVYYSFKPARKPRAK